ncbi:unnamed protein product [Durusdinium trenchii]|uniref:Protein kinase domain-containing protein n=1 Tax=Durusdinium trenchii TaxID=1381693 RepID=A0ABP0NES6_9DINO
MMWTHHDDGDQSPGAPPDAKPEATAEGKPEATAEAMAEATTEAAVETSAEATAPAPEPPALSLTPKPVPVSQAIPQGFRSLAVPDVGETASARDRIPAVPRLILPDPPMCLTRMPLAQSAQLPPQLDACGFELDVLAPQLGSGAYAAVRKLRHRKTGREADNILLSLPEFDVRICDFGWSAEATLDKLLLTTCGTPEFWAPEQWSRAPQSYSTDCWALGCLFYEEIKEKVLVGDARYPPFLSQAAMSLLHCHLQVEPQHRAPCSWSMQKHEFLEDERSLDDS